MSSINDLKIGLSPKVIACVAGIWSNDSYCLPFQKAVDVIKYSGTRILVLHIPSEYETTSQNSTSEAINFHELIQALDIPYTDMVLFFNTSLCHTLNDVERVIKSMNYLQAQQPYKNIPSFLKLEIFDDDFMPNDKIICEILEKIPREVRKICIPYIKGESGAIRYLIELGCPALRIWCSQIGKGDGIIDSERLERIVKNKDVPFILEGGIATPQDVQKALKIGFDAVLINSAFRNSRNPIALALEIRNIIDSTDNKKNQF